MSVRRLLGVAATLAVATTSALMVTPAHADSPPTLVTPGASNLRLGGFSGGSGGVPRWVDVTSSARTVTATWALSADGSGRAPTGSYARIGPDPATTHLTAFASAGQPVGDWSSTLTLTTSFVPGRHLIGMGGAWSSSAMIQTPALLTDVYVVKGAVLAEPLTEQQWAVPVDGLEVNQTWTPPRLPAMMPTGSGTTVTYQWFDGSTPVTSATTSTAAITPPTHLEGRSVRLRITGTRSGYATTTVWSPAMAVTGLRVTPTAPTQLTGGRYRIPSTPGVEYFADGSTTPLTAGEHDGRSRLVVVTARAAQGFWIPSAATREWTFDFRQVVDVPAPSWDRADGTVTVPEAAHVEYLLDGSVLAAGTHQRRGLFTLTARVTSPEHRFGDGAVVQWTADTRREVTPEPATFDPDQMTWTVPDQPGVTWTVGGSPVTPGTHRVTSTTTVVATPTAADDTWVLTATPTLVAPFVLTTVPVAAVTLDVASRAVTIPAAAAGVRYLLDGEPIGEGRHDLGRVAFAVTAEPTLPRFALAGTRSWSGDWRTPVTPLAPVRDAGTGTVLVPGVVGVEYLHEGQVVAAGTELSGTSVEITARAADAHHRIAPGVTVSWSFDARPVVTPVAPVLDPEAMSFTLPVVAGASWERAGAPVAPGTYPVEPPAGDVLVDEVVLRADADHAPMVRTYSLVFTWSRVTPPAPTVSAHPAGDRITVPDVAGVGYRIDGAPVAAGEVDLQGLVQLTAHPASRRHLLDGTTTWTLDTRRTATPVAPVVDAERMTYTVPTVEGLRYQRGTTVLAPGTHSFDGRVELRAVPAGPGWKVDPDATAAWTLDVEVETVTASAPTVHGDVVRIPEQPRVRYRIEGQVVAAGDHPVQGWVTVTAEATTPRVRLTGTRVWDLDARRTVLPVAPTFDRTTGRLRLPSTPGLRYRVAGRVATGVQDVTGTVRVTAEPATGEVRIPDTAVSEWTFTRTGPVTVAARKPSFSKRTGVLRIPRVAGLQYRVGSRTVAGGSKVRVRKGRKVVVTVRALPGYRVTGTARWTFRRR